MNWLLLIDELTWRFSKRTSIAGIDVGMFLAHESQTKVAFAKLEAALRLLQNCDPRRCAYLRRDVRRILVSGSSDVRGEWHQDCRMCELTDSYVLAEDTTPAMLAATLAHEAMHARLYRWGFGYEEAIRARIEAVCIKASMSFARRLPLSEISSRGSIMCGCTRLLNRPAASWAPEARLEAKGKAMRDLGAPEWLVGLFIRLATARLRRYRRKFPPQGRRSGDPAK